MRGVDYQVKVSVLQEHFDLRNRQTLGRDGQALRLREQGLPVFCGHASGDFTRLRVQELDQLASLCGSAKNTNLIHPDTLAA